MTVRGVLLAVVAAGALAGPGGRTAAAQRSEPLPPALAGVGITEHLGARIPLGLDFTAEDGTPVRLSTYFDGKRPVILTLNYYRCPMLCGLLLHGLVDGMKDIDAMAATARDCGVEISDFAMNANEGWFGGSAVSPCVRTPGGETRRPAQPPP